MESHEYIDKIIGKTLYENEEGKIRSNKLYRLVCETIKKEKEKKCRATLEWKIPSREVFFSHIEKMCSKEEGRLCRQEDEEKPQTVYYSLTPKEKAAVRLKITENKQIYLLCLILAATGITTMKYTSEPKPGAILINPGKKGHGFITFDRNLPGVGVSDFSTKLRVFPIGKLFKYLKDFSKSKVKKRLGELEATYPNLIEHFEYNKELRYKVKDPIVEEFLTHCNSTLYTILNKMEFTWQYLKKPTEKSEIEWYELICGKQRAKEFFLNAQTKRECLTKKNNALEEINETNKVTNKTTNKTTKASFGQINRFDTYIRNEYKQLTVEWTAYNKNSHEEFLLFKEELLEQIVFPPFLQKYANNLY